MFNYSKIIFKGPENEPQRPRVPALAQRADKSADFVRKREETAKKLRVDKEKLYDHWVKNNPKGTETPLEDDPKNLALHEIKVGSVRNEAYVLLGLVEKFLGGRQNAMELYKKAWSEKNFDIDTLRKYFTEERTKGVLGFYYGTNKRIQAWVKKHGKKLGMSHYRSWDPITMHADGSDYIKEVPGKNFSSTWIWNKKWNVTGWWTYDETPGDYDEFTFSHDIQGATPKIITELKDEKNNDSGLDFGQSKEVRTALVTLSKEPQEAFNKSVTKKDVLTWFKKNPDQWVKLDESILGKMNFLFGRGAGFFKYRYVPEKNKIYFVAIDGTQLEKNWPKFGYLDIKKGELGDSRNGQEEEDFKKMIGKEVIAERTPEQIKNELNSYEALYGNSTSEAVLLAPTAGILNSLLQKYKLIPVKYNLLNTNFYDKLQGFIKKELIDTKKYSEDDAVKFANARIERLKKDVEAKIDEKKDILRQAVDDNSDVQLEIRIDTSDKIEVSLQDSKVEGRLKKAANATLGAVKSAVDLAKEKYAEAQKKLKKWGIFGVLLDKWLNLKDSIEEYYKTGKKGLFLMIFGPIIGLKLGRGLIGSKTIDGNSTIEKLAKTKKGVLEDKRVINSEFKLSGYKIVIPKGMGIKPGAKFNVLLKGISGTQEADPNPKEEEKKGVDIGGLLGGGEEKGEEFLYKTHEITINKNTTIPKGTIIPKGSKIVKV